MTQWTKLIACGLFVAGTVMAAACSGGDRTAGKENGATQTANGTELAQNEVKDHPAEEHPSGEQPAVDTPPTDAEPKVNPLLNPKSPEMNQQAPDVFKAKLETSKGDVVIEVHRDWSPLGADRFYNLVKNGFYDDTRFFRVLKGFMAQFGLNGDPQISSVWRSANIADDPVKQKNTRGMVSYAMAGPNTRTTQLFINYGDNSRLDAQGFSPFGKVIEGMNNVEALYADYGEGAPAGKGPHQGQIQAMGNTYLKESFPELDYIKKATILTE
jgi:peptidyl-prolyl cis-trans isomerase A (cyclophilin A)